MDRARQAGAHGHHRRRHAARLILACAALGAAACRDLTIDPDRVIVIEVPTTTLKVQEGDTLRLSARLLNAAGAVVPGVSATWAADDSVTGFTLDANSGLVTAVKPGTWPVWARFEKLQSDRLTLTVTPLPAPSAFLTNAFVAGCCGPGFSPQIRSSPPETN